MTKIVYWGMSTSNLDIERKNASFNIREMTFFLDGGPAETKVINL